MNKRRAVTSLWIALFLGACLYGWWRGSPYLGPYHSPNGQYYIQKYHNISLSSFAVGMPGQGSDRIDGYIRLYDRSGRLLAERFTTMVRDVEPVWAGDAVYLMGVAEMDTSPWRLPTPASD